jgi:hypothetical protein
VNQQFLGTAVFVVHLFDLASLTWLRRSRRSWSSRAADVMLVPAGQEDDSERTHDALPG